MGQEGQEKATFSETQHRYVQVADRIAELIESGKLRPDDQIPGEFDLADQYGVALATARRAVRELRNRRLVHTIPGKGSFVLPRQTPDKTKG